jgi:hypothetical protein
MKDVKTNFTLTLKPKAEMSVHVAKGVESVQL